MENNNTEDVCVLVVVSEKEMIKDTSPHVKNSNNVTYKTLSDFQKDALGGEKFHTVILLIDNIIKSASILLPKIIAIQTPNGNLKILNVPKQPARDLEFHLKTNGYVNVVTNEVDDKTAVLECTKPSYKIGSTNKLNLSKPSVAAVWKLDDVLDDEVDIIDPDNLLDEDDLLKPDPTSLRVCGTTGKRKACKDCSCGLADELEIEAKTKAIIETGPALPKSSCGSCYLGDAFRCAGCPYAGMPAFKPGEKIQLSDIQLKADT